MTSRDQDLATILQGARDFHGHLGPFLVLGVRAGMIALRELRTDNKNHNLQAAAWLILSIPYSCILDGIQFATGCTIGNRRLRFEDSSDFKISLEDSENGKVTISILPKVVDALMRELSGNLPTHGVERLAQKVAATAEQELFAIDRQ